MKLSRPATRSRVLITDPHPPVLCCTLSAGGLLTLASSWCLLVLRHKAGLQRLQLALPSFAIYVLVPFLFCHETELLSVAAVAYLSFRLPLIKVRRPTGVSSQLSSGVGLGGQGG